MISTGLLDPLETCAFKGSVSHKPYCGCTARWYMATSAQGHVRAVEEGGEEKLVAGHPDFASVPKCREREKSVFNDSPFWSFSSRGVENLCLIHLTRHLVW